MSRQVRPWATSRRLAHAIGAAVLAGALASSLAAPALGQPVVVGGLPTQSERPTTTYRATFGNGTAEAIFGEEIVFRQPVTTDGVTVRAEALLEPPGAIGPVVTEIPGPALSGSTTLEYRLSPTDDGHLLPNTTLVVRFRLTGADDTVTTGPPIRVTYDDTRFDWRTESGDLVRVHWYEGDDAVGRRALSIAEEAMANAETFLGVTESEPVDFFLYADDASWYDAVGPQVGENNQGLADASIRTLLAWTGPDGLGNPYVPVVIAHELTHLVFDTAAKNPYHFWPHWLDEGVADYLAQGYSPRYRSLVREAVRQGTLIPLNGLSGQFPTVYERYLLAYSESVSAVDFLVREHGTEALSRLINSFAEGLSDDEAFVAAIGQTTGEFNASWFAHLGAEVPEAFGPQPAPAGPLPPAWLAPPAPGASAPPSPGASPDASAGSTPLPGGGAGGSIAGSAAALLLIGGIGALVLGVAWLSIRRRRPAATAPSGPTGVSVPPSTGDATPATRDPFASFEPPAAAPAVGPGSAPQTDETGSP